MKNISMYGTVSCVLLEALVQGQAQICESETQNQKTILSKRMLS